MALERGKTTWQSAAELSRRIARVAVVFVDAVHAHEEPLTATFDSDLYPEELKAWRELEKLVAAFKATTGD